MKTCSIFVLTLILDFYDLGSSGLPSVPGTDVITPPITTQGSLTIYYDAMEEKSQVFFNTTLVKEFSGFSSYIELFFIPCQQATNKNEDLRCPAQADPQCNADKTHSCAIAQTTDQTQLINFLACTMNSVQKLPDFSTCATQNQIDDKKLQSCATSDTGKSLCKDHSGQKTANSTTIPGFIFKNPKDAQESDPFQNTGNFINNVYLTDFKSALCAQLGVIHASKMPEECNQFDKLIVGIFYKAMDEKSQKWFQMFTTEYDSYSDHLNIKYVPCVQAELSDSGTLDCKDEADTGCVAAKTHACAVSIITDPKALFQFISCAVKDVTKKPDFQKCATESKIAYEPIKQCAESDTGKQLCINYGKMGPKSDKIPSFSYELTFDEAVSKETSEATNVTNLLCRMMKQYAVAVHPDCLIQEYVTAEMAAFDGEDGDAQESDPFQNTGNFINNVYLTDFKSALCAQLGVIHASKMPEECDQFNKLIVGIFYKAMDEKSQKWFQMFATEYDRYSYSNYLNIKYVPCVQAELSHSGTLDCKDKADTGCAAAKTHACAVSIITDPKALFQFISCAVKDVTKKPDFQKCATESKIAYEPIKKCAESDTGKQLCINYGKMGPKSDKIPSFSYELTFDEAISAKTSEETSIKNLLCLIMEQYHVAIHPDCLIPQYGSPFPEMAAYGGGGMYG